MSHWNDIAIGVPKLMLFALSGRYGRRWRKKPDAGHTITDAPLDNPEAEAGKNPDAGDRCFKSPRSSCGDHMRSPPAGGLLLILI